MIGAHGSLASDPACEQLAGCAVPRHARHVAGPAKKTGAVGVVERLQSNASVQRVLFDPVLMYLSHFDSAQCAYASVTEDS